MSCFFVLRTRNKKSLNRLHLTHFKCKLKYIKGLCPVPAIYKLTQKKKKSKVRDIIYHISWLCCAIFLTYSLPTCAE